MLSRIVVLVVCLGFFLPGYLSAQPDRNAKVSQLVVGLKSASQVQRVNAAKSITRNHGNDEKVFNAAATALSDMSKDFHSADRSADAIYNQS